MNAFAYLFLAAVTLGLVIELWLLGRHRRHVMAHRGQAPAAFGDRISLEAHQKAADYTDAKARLGRWELGWGSLILIGWVLGGGVVWLNAGLQALEWSPMTTGVALLLSVPLISALLELPFGVYRTFVLEQRFGFNRTTPGRFALDLLLQGALILGLGIPLAWAVLWVMMLTGPYWWVAAWVIWMVFSLLVAWAFPTFIAPLFNKFTPLQEGELKSRIQDLLARNGFASKGVFVMDGSRRSSHGNAYFTGLGKAKRIVFFDTLLETLQPPEVEAVLAHELGHFKKKHIRNGLILSAVLSFLGLALIGWLMLEPWFYRGLGIFSDSQAMDLLVMLLVLPAFTQFLSPLMAWYQRRHEFEADDFARAETGSGPMVDALVKLYRENAATLTPDPLYSAYHDSHPPAPVRVAHLQRGSA